MGTTADRRLASARLCAAGIASVLVATEDSEPGVRAGLAAGAMVAALRALDAHCRIGTLAGLVPDPICLVPGRQGARWS